MSVIAPPRRGRPRGRSTSLSSGRRLRAAAQARVRELVDAVVDEDERGHRERDRHAREDEVPPRALQHGRVVLRPVEDHAPARPVDVAEAEELEPRREDDRAVEDEDEAGRDPADHVGHDLAPDDPPGALAGDLRGEHEVAVDDRERLAAQDARLDRPGREAEDQHHDHRAARRDEGRDHDQQRQRRDDEEDVREQVDRRRRSSRRCRRRAGRAPSRSRWRRSPRRRRRRATFARPRRPARRRRSPGRSSRTRSPCWAAGRAARRGRSGEFCASSGAARAAATMPAKTMMPAHDFGFASSRRAQPGRPSRRRRCDEGRRAGRPARRRTTAREARAGAIPLIRRVRTRGSRTT